MANDIYYRLVQRRDTAANWGSENPILANGEFGVVTDATDNSNRVKIGDGSTAWNSLDWFKGTDEGGGTTYQAGNYINIDSDSISVVISETVDSTAENPVIGKAVYNYVENRIGNIETLLSNI